MKLNIAQTTNSYGFENRENQNDVAMGILKRQGASEDVMQKLAQKTIFDSTEGRIYSNAQLSILKAASQISLNGNLKETLKYLKKPVKKETKTPVLGELWNLFTQKQEEFIEVYDWEVDFSAENIFAA